MFLDEDRQLVVGQEFAALARRQTPAGRQIVDQIERGRFVVAEHAVVQLVVDALEKVGGSFAGGLVGHAKTVPRQIGSYRGYGVILRLRMALVDSLFLGVMVTLNRRGLQLFVAGQCQAAAYQHHDA